jgi:hypothetical protein
MCECIGVDDDRPFGTAGRDAPVPRTDFERAVRALHVADLETRDALLQLAARVVALTDEMTRRLDGVEPVPAPPNTPAPAATTTVEGAVEQHLEHTLAQIRAADAAAPPGVSLDIGDNKYAVAPVDIPCHELIPLCHARCCKLSFSLSTADLDEGIIRWDYGQPYLIRQRASDGYCVHNDPATHGCTVHNVRPRVCRTFDCRDDKRIWIDFAQRIPAPLEEGTLEKLSETSAAFDLLERARARAVAHRFEAHAIRESFADPEPRRGPK